MSDGSAGGTTATGAFEGGALTLGAVLGPAATAAAGDAFGAVLTAGAGVTGATTFGAVGITAVTGGALGDAAATGIRATFVVSPASPITATFPVSGSKVMSRPSGALTLVPTLPSAASVVRRPTPPDSVRTA